jgi:hypothetical protein
MSIITKFVESLKKHLEENKSKYVEHDSWCGCTESGFYETDDFDMDKLMAEIDEFSKTFK